MISFKEFLNNRIINEDIQDDIQKIKKDPIKSVLYNWVKKHTGRNKFTGLNSEQKKNQINIIISGLLEPLKKIAENPELRKDENFNGNLYLEPAIKKLAQNGNQLKSISKKIDELIKDDGKLLFTEIEKMEKMHEDSIENYSSDIGKVEGNKFRESFFKYLILNKNSIEKLNSNNIKEIISFFRASNQNGDKRIDKNEFVNAINKIKKAYKNDLAIPATILFLLYLKQNAMEKNDGVKIFNKDGSTIDGNYLSNLADDSNFYVKDGKPTNKLDDLNALFKSFGNLQIDKSVLSYFKNIKAAENFLKQEKINKDELKGNFTQKTQEVKEQDKAQDDIEQKKAEKEEFIKQHEEEEKKLNPQMNNIKDKVTANQEIENSVEKEIMQKRQFYIFKAKMIKASNVEDSNDIDDFIEAIRKNAEELMNDAKRKMELLKKEEKSTNLSEGLGDFFKKITTPKTYDDKFSKSSEDIDNIEKKANTQIENIASSIGKTLKNLFGQINSETKFNKKIKLELQFDQTVNEFGYLMTKAVQQFTRDVDSIASKLNKHKKAEDLKDVKSFTQEGNENIAITMIKRLFDKANCNITEKIARFFLTNLILNYHDSKKIIEALNQNNFDGLGNCVFTSNNQVPIYTKYDIKQLNNNVTYYEIRGSDWIKNPATLLEKAGIKVSSLSHDVLQKAYGILKKYADENKKDVDAYKEAIITINSGIKASVMSEEDINQQIQSAAPLPTEQRLDSIAAAGGQLLKDDFKGFILTGNQPDDIAFGQYCSANNYIVVSNNKNKLYLFNKQSFDNLVKTLEQIKSTEQNKANINNTPTNAENVNNNSQNNSSVVTSANADSTYGNGYNKKADAIKKKLNCTTYTYSPNPKLKIVRRTFD